MNQSPTLKEYANGSKEWYLNGKPHRVDGPAIEYADGDKHWYLNGKWHRVDGPALMYADGERHWYLKGIRFSEEEHKYYSTHLVEFELEYGEQL